MTALSPRSQQALRTKRFLIAASTYALGLMFVGLCSAIGLFPTDRLVWVGAVFLLVNMALFAAFRSDFNLRFNDPSLTLIQVSIGAVMIFFILILGDQIHFLAIPFYSSLFVFAMLRLTPRELVSFELFVLVTYGVAVAIRYQAFASQMDLRVELIYAVIVALSSCWFAMAAGYISNLRARLRSSVQANEQLAIRDGLTNVWNRRHMDALLVSELERKARIGGELCVCMVDLDHFKRINDRYGHPVGDTALRSVATSMKARLRSIDQLGRFGGEEFLIILPGASLEEAHGCAQRLLQGVAALSILPDSQHRVTISAGLAECAAGESCATLMARVDSALYQAKQGGRNRVAISKPQVQASQDLRGCAASAVRSQPPATVEFSRDG